MHTYMRGKLKMEGNRVLMPESSELVYFLAWRLVRKEKEKKVLRLEYTQVFSASRAIEKHWPKKKSQLILVKIFFSLILVIKAGPCLHSLSYCIVALPPTLHYSYDYQCRCILQDEFTKEPKGTGLLWVPPRTVTWAQTFLVTTSNNSGEPQRTNHFLEQL